MSPGSLGHGQAHCESLTSSSHWHYLCHGSVPDLQTSLEIAKSHQFLSSCKITLPYTGTEGTLGNDCFSSFFLAFAFTRTFFFYSSGETVTSVTSLAPLQPKKNKRRKEKADVPPAVPAKGRKPACSDHDLSPMTHPEVHLRLDVGSGRGLGRGRT